MKKKRSLCLDDSDDIIRPPAYPVAGYKLLEQLRGATKLDGRISPPTLPRLARYLGIPISTCHQRFSVGRLSGIQSMLCVMERMEEFQWVTILEKYLRDFPTLRHSRLAHDREGVARLYALLDAREGLTFIRGGSDADRTFLMTALGHTLATRSTGCRRMVGMDRHEPRTFVPVENVLYFRNGIPESRFRKLVLSEWEAIRQKKMAFVFLNRVVSAAPAVATDLPLMAEENHIIIAEADSVHPLNRLKWRRVIKLLETRPSGELRWELLAR